jgi:hypothetical protein
MYFCKKITLKESRLNIWIKLKDHFIRESNIRAIKRYGEDTIIERYEGESIVIPIAYDKVKKIINK